MRKFALTLAATLSVCCALAANASADALPPGTYTAALTSVSLRAGGPLGRLLGTQTISLARLRTVPVNVPILPVPVTVSFRNVTVPALDLHALAPSRVGSGSSLQLTLASPVTVTAAPLTGSGSVRALGYATAKLSDPVVSLVSATCTVGSAARPVPISLSTAAPAGSPYDAATGGIKLAGSVSLSSLKCEGVSLGSLLTGPVDVVLDGRIRPRPAATRGFGSSEPLGSAAGRSVALGAKR